jgi:hypothetical protein
MVPIKIVINTFFFYGPLSKYDQIFKRERGQLNKVSDEDKLKIPIMNLEKQFI